MKRLNVHNLSKSFGDSTVLETISLQLNQGEIVGLFGRNGTGKTTLMKTLFGTLKADSIQLQLNEDDIIPKSVIPSKLIGYLPQEPFLPKQIKVRNIIPMFYPSSNDQDIIFYAPKVRTFDQKRVGELSLGQRRYLEVLLISNLEHPFLLLDEPFSMIEPLYKEEIKKLLQKLTFYKGIMISDHYYEDVLDITSRNYLLKDKQLLAINSKEELIKGNYLKYPE